MTASTAARTPGPWIVEIDTVFGSIPDGLTALHAEKICQCARYNGDSTGIANAAFIVTACNAYDADRALIAQLTAALRSFVERGNKVSGCPAQYQPWVGELVNARALLKQIDAVVQP